jgi:putative acetyltransferase
LSTNPAEVKIRPEAEQDQLPIHQVNAEAFETETEAKLVDALRNSGIPLVSLVAEQDDAIVGHILFSPMTDAQGNLVPIAGLAPMAVAPGHQKQGIGSALVRAGLEQCRAAGYQAVIVLGHPDYYPRFGFVPASRFGIQCQFEAPDEAFMALELLPGALAEIAGVVNYHPLFDQAA